MNDVNDLASLGARPESPVSGRPLARRHVVTTRNERGRLDSLLAAAGADVIHVPLIRIIDAVEGPDRLAAATRGLDDGDWLVVTSRHGASRVAAVAARRPGLRLAAVGRSSAAELERACGRPVDVVPKRQTAADLAEALLPGPARAVVAQGDLADDTLTAGLVAIGYDVTAVTVYRTELRQPSLRQRLAVSGADAVAFASGSAAAAWAQTIGTETPPVVAVIGQTTADVASASGLKATHVASDHDLEGLVAIVTSALTPS